MEGEFWLIEIKFWRTGCWYIENDNSSSLKLPLQVWHNIIIHLVHFFIYNFEIVNLNQAQSTIWKPCGQEVWLKKTNEKCNRCISPLKFNSCPWQGVLYIDHTTLYDKVCKWFVIEHTVSLETPVVFPPIQFDLKTMI